MNACLALLTLLFVATSASAEPCIDPAKLSDSVLRIRRDVVEIGKNGKRENFRIAATVWRYDASAIATVEHVVKSMQLSADKWSPVMLGREKGERSGLWEAQTVSVRIERIEETGGYENIYVLRVKGRLKSTLIPPIRDTPLANFEPVVTIGYPNGRLKYGYGHFWGRETGEDAFPVSQDRYLAEIYGIYDHVEFTEGSSGSPLFDCDGKIIASISQYINPLGRDLAKLKRNLITKLRELKGMPPENFEWDRANMVVSPIVKLTTLNIEMQTTEHGENASASKIQIENTQNTKLSVGTTEETGG